MSTLLGVDDVQAGSTLIVRNGLKWTYHDEGVLAAWVAEMDFGLAPSITEALHAGVARADTGYFYPDLMDATAVAATSFWADRLDWSVSPDRVFHVPDVIEGIRRAIIHLTAPGSPVILHTPVYYPFFSMVERAGRDLVDVRSLKDADGRYGLDLERIAAAFAVGAGSIVLCNPWNPTGRSLTRQEITGLIEVATTHNARVIVDEVHAPMTYAGFKHLAAATLDPDTVVTVTSASKAFNIPGLKAAQVVLTNDADASTWSDYFTLDKVSVGTFGLLGNAAAYADGREWLDDVMSRLESNRVLLGELVESLLPAAGYRPPEATFLAWLDFQPYGLTDPGGHMLEKARVALEDGVPFGAGGEGHARINFATSEDVLTEMVERMAGAL